MKANRPIRGVYIVPAIFLPVFAFLWATIGLADGAKSPDNLVAFFALMVGMGNTFTLMSSLIPSRLGTIQSDGSQLLDLWRRRPRRSV